MGLGLQKGATGSNNPTLVQLLTEALRSVGQRDLALRAGLRSRLAMAVYFQRELAYCRRLAHGAVADARRTGNRTLLLSTLLVQRLALWGPDEREAQDAVLTEMLVLLEQGAGDSIVREVVYNWVAQQAFVRGSRRDLEIALARWRAEVEGAPGPGLLGSLRLAEANQALMEGRLEAAETATEWVTRELADVDDPGLENRQQYCMAQYFFQRRERGELAGLEPAVRAMVADYPHNPSWRAALILLLADEGRAEDAQREMDHFRGAGLVRLPRDGTWLPVMAVLAEAAAATGQHTVAREILGLLEPLGPRNVVLVTGIHCFGSLSRYRGLLLEALGECDAAETALEEALVDDTRAGNLLAVAYDQVALARLLRAGAGRDRCRRAGHMLAAAREFAQARSLTRLLRLVEATAPPLTAAAAVAPGAVLRRAGNGWQAALGNRSGHLRDARGLLQIHHLLQNPGLAVAARELAALGASAGPLPSARHDPELTTHGQEARPVVLDKRALNEIRHRLHELENEITSAEDDADLGRAETLRAQRNSIVDTLERGLGLGGRSREFGSTDERARLNVTRSIRSAIAQVRRVVPDLGAHLDRMITTGGLCSYSPDPLAPLKLDLF